MKKRDNFSKQEVLKIQKIRKTGKFFVSPNQKDLKIGNFLSPNMENKKVFHLSKTRSFEGHRKCSG